MTKTRTVDMSEHIDEETPKKGKRIGSKDKKTSMTKAGPKSHPADAPKTTDDSTETTLESTSAKHERSKRYQQARSQVDRTINYAPAKAIELLKKVSRPKHPTIVADIIYKDTKFAGEVTFPHSTGKSVKVAVVDDKLLASIEKGQIDFDVLLATPEYMPKLAKLARILGPKGLMPNPKNGTLTKDVAKKQKELAGGKVSIKTEKSAPLIHVQIGKIDQPDQEILDNISALVKTLNAHKVAKLVISSTMSPGIKVDTSSYITI